MNTTRAIGAAATLLAVLAASGCGGGSSSGASSPSPKKASASASSHTTEKGIASGEPAPPTGTKSASAKPTPSSSGTAAGAPGVPEAARQHTKAGAKAFARYYMGLLNETGLHPKVGILEPLALSTCKSCKNHQNSVRELVAEKQHFTKRQMSVKSVAIAGDTQAATNVEVHGYEPKVDIVGADGGFVKSYPEVRDQGLIFELYWTRQGWRIATVKNVVK